KDQLVGHLKKVIKAEKAPEFDNFPADKLKLWKVTIPDDRDDLLSNLTLQDQVELLATREIGDYWTEKPPKSISILEEALSCIPPPITYSPDCVTLKTTTKAIGDPPANVQLWDDFFDKVNQFRFDQQPIFERPRFDDRFVIVDEEVKRIYGILSTYDNHWFLRREHAKLWISKTLPLESESPPVLKAYAYLTRQAKENPKSPKPQVVVPVQGDNDSRTLRSHSKSSSNSSLNQQQSSSTFANQQSSSNTSVKQNNYSFSDFKFKSILGEGRSGKTLLCEFRGDMIALKSADLSKAPSYVLEEMQKEVEIYKDLADIQGKYIPKLICYGYYGGGMSFVIGLTIVGTMLSDHKITKRQRSRAIKGLEAIHKHGILHNDIREENILINDNGDIYLIDFGMASREDTKKKRKLFDEEQLKLSQLLDRYIM
ncbi:kinase-like protein, partial [Rhizophagus irregularis]